MVTEYISHIPNESIIAGISLGLYIVLRLYLVVRDIGRLDPAA